MAEGVRTQPFTAFNFAVKLFLSGKKDEICAAEFSECSGLELNMEPKSIREGGNNGQAIHLVGQVSYGQLSLKRGMTANFDLWNWFERVQRQRNLRADGEVQMLASALGGADGDRKKNAVFKLTGCLPLKIKAPTLAAQDGAIAIEEMQIAYETLSLQVQAQE